MGVSRDKEQTELVKRWREWLSQVTKGKTDDQTINRLARYAIKQELTLSSVRSYKEVQKLQEGYYQWYAKIKPRKVVTDSQRGSLHRLLRYITLKSELAKPGLQLMPELAPQTRKAVPDVEVVELKLSFTVKEGSDHYRLFNVDHLPAQIKPWLKQIVRALDDDESARFSETFSADMNRYPDISAWKMEKTMGYPTVGHELLKGFPVAVELPGGIGSDPALVVLEPHVPPKELGRIWDNIYTSSKVDKKGYQLWLTAMQEASKEASTFNIDDFMTHFARAAVEFISNDPGQFAHLSEEEEKEQLTRYIPQFMATYHSERLQKLREKHLTSIDFEAERLKIQAESKSKHRPRPFSLQQEILGRAAFDVCLEGIWADDRGYSATVWAKYRTQASGYGVNPEYYGTAGETRKALTRIGKDIRKIEKLIDAASQPFGAPSPFRRLPKV